MSDNDRFRIFRGGEAIDLEASGVMSYAKPTPEEQRGAERAIAAGMLEGSVNELLFSAPGWSLARIWFKSSYPLPRHRHDTGCLYFILGGSLTIGSETLGPGDGFFVGADVPYTYRPGHEGIELLEFRGSNDFDIKMLADNPAYWEEAVATVEARRDRWRGERRPTQTP